MKTSFALALAAVGGAAGIGAGEAQAQLAVSGGIGTTGGKVELQYQVIPHLVIRGGYNYFEYEADDAYEDIAYSGDLDLTTFGAFVDFHPLGGAFMITAGVYQGDKGLDLVADPANTYQIGGQTFTSAQVGELRLKADLESSAPFIGLGWDTTYTGSGPFGFKFIAGAMFTGSPQVDLISTGGTRTQQQDAAFQQALLDEEADLQDEVDDYEIYPVVEVGLTFRF
jgi:hypothetical protein